MSIVSAEGIVIFFDKESLVNVWFETKRMRGSALRYAPCVLTTTCVI